MMIHGMTGPPQLAVESLRQELQNCNQLQHHNIMLLFFQLARDGNHEAFQILEEHTLTKQCKFACGYVSVLLTSDKVSGIARDIGRADLMMQSILDWLFDQSKKKNMNTFRHVQFFLVNYPNSICNKIISYIAHPYHHTLHTL